MLRNLCRDFHLQFSGALVNATVLTLLLKSFAEKKNVSVAAFQLTLPDSCAFSPFLAPGGIIDFGIVLAKHCNLAFCSFILQIY